MRGLVGKVASMRPERLRGSQVIRCREIFFTELSYAKQLESRSLTSLYISTAGLKSLLVRKQYLSFDLWSKAEEAG